VDNFACAIAWMPGLMINTANESRKGVAATESFRNVMVEQGTQAQQAMLAVAQLPSQRHPHPHGGYEKPMEITEK
jgi:hypothetical protein